MSYTVSVPAENERGPLYLTGALQAVLRSFRGRVPLELRLERHGAHVGMTFRCADTLAPIVAGQLAAAYPDARIERLTDGVSAPGYWARLRLRPWTTALVSAEEFLDREQRQLADPLATLLAVIASGRREAAGTAVTLAVRPVSRLRRWWLRRRHADVAKFAGPLWAADIRLSVAPSATGKRSALVKLHELAGALAPFLPPGVAEWRLSRVRRGTPPPRVPLLRSTFLTSQELALLWHPPTVSVRTPQLHINESRELEPPAPGLLPTLAEHAGLAVLGRTNFRRRREVFGLLPDDRMRHVVVTGQTGTGKTTLLTNLIESDVAAGRAVVVLDPHGDMIERLLDSVPPARTNHVILFDPADPANSVSYNPLACSSVDQRPLVASAVLTSFKRLFAESWGPRLEHILRNCLLTLLENPGTTLVSLHRLLVEEPFRKQLVGRVGDEIVRTFWQSEFARWTPQFRSEALSPVLNKIGAFTANPILRSVLGDATAKLNLRHVLDSGQVLFCNLSKGRLGDDAATLIGSLLVAGVQLAAMRRADQREQERRPAMLFVDEFQNFVAGETFPTLLSEMRKFKIALHCAHQFQAQLDEATAAAVWGNVGTVVAFRLGQDAELVAEQMGGDLLPGDLRSLPQYHAYARLLVRGVPSRPFSMATLPPSQVRRPRAEIVRRISRERYGSLRSTTPAVCYAAGASLTHVGP